jgi:hypothetical protein
MTLLCISRYRSVGKGLFVEPGEVLRYLSQDDEDFLLRDAPGCFRRVSDTASGPDAPGPGEQERREICGRLPSATSARCHNTRRV